MRWLAPLLLCLLLPAQAGAAVCASSAAIEKVLSERHGEQPVGFGPTMTNKSLLTLMVSPEGTWSVVMTLAEGNACIIGVGHSWERLPLPIAGEDG